MKHIFTFQKISKPTRYYLIKIFGIWTLLNIILNLLGLWITQLLTPGKTVLLESVSNELAKPLALQSLLFTVCIFAGHLFLKNKKTALYSFAIIQAIVFHLIFFINLKFHNVPFFVSSYNSAGLQYMSYCGQYLVDILYQFVPLKGNYENGMFMPLNIGKFYFHWIFLNLLYYFGLTWISERMATLFPKKFDSTKLNSEEQPTTTSEE